MKSAKLLFGEQWGFQMREVILSLLVTLSVACSNRQDFQCVQSSACDLSGGGMCFTSPTGSHWCAYPDPECPSGYRYSTQDVGDGLSGMCVPDTNPMDAGIDGDEGVGTDAPLNCPQTAPVQSGQASDLVLGQPGFTSGTANNPSLNGGTLATTVGLATDGARLWVWDSGNARVLQWNSFPAVNEQSANVAIGQPNLITATPGVTASQLAVGGGYIARAGTKLVVSDGVNNRVLIWNSVPTSSGQAADLVLGQTSFTTKTNGNSASQLYGPLGVWTDGTRLIVADRFNNRVLIWNAFPTTNAAPADVVVGASDFGMSPNITPPTASSLHGPAGLTVHAGKLYVADNINHRVLIWNAIPTVNNAPADVVLGQTGFDGYFANAGAAYPQVNAIGMKGPEDVLVDACGSLYVCDDLNGRVLVYTASPSTTGSPADAVLGKSTLTTQPNAGTNPSETWMAGCSGLAVAGASLYVGDDSNNRALRFALSR